MAKLSEARRVALAVLSERRRRNGRVRDLLRTSDAMAALDARDRSLASRLALGTVSAQGVLDEVLAAYVRRPSSLEPRVRDALRLASFEALYLETPDSVVVSQGVELVRSVVPRASGMANAVLRKVVSQERPKVEEAREAVSSGTSTFADLTLVSGLPAWLLQHIVETRGLQVACQMALAQLEPAPVYVASNRAKLSDEDAERLLEEAGLSPQPTMLPGSWVLETPAGLATAGLVQDTRVVVSDLAAQQVANMTAPSNGERLLEIGQGRGTKTILLQNAAQLNGGFADIEAVDSEAFKVRVATHRMESAGLSAHVSCHVLDARTLGGQKLPKSLEGPFDLVFIDAPCSGTGTMRRHPEIPWSLSPDALTGEGSLSELQLQILTAAATRVAAGGRLAYATCSVLPEENEQVIEAFLATDSGARFARSEMLQTIPQIGSCDGHFCCVLRCATYPER